MACSVLKPSWRFDSGIPGAFSAGRRGRLVLVESHSLLREGLALSISSHMREAEVECCRSVEEVIPGPARLLLVGADPHREGEAQALRIKFQTLRDRCGQAPIGVVMAHDDSGLRRMLGALGVAGVVQHEASLAVAIAAIQLMWVGGSCFPAEGAFDPDMAIAAPASAPEQDEALGSALTVIAATPARKMVDCEMSLTSRECDVLRSLRAGRQNKIIAHELGISESTVKVHLRNMMKKLHASNRTQVALGASPQG